MQAKLDGKVALVTGSSKGIGKAVALKLADNGADVVVNARTPAAALEVVAQIQQMGRRAVYEQADITDYAQVRGMVASALDRMGQIDILVANGGPGQPRPRFFRDIEPASYMDYVVTRWLSRAYCIRAVLDHMIERQKGKIVSITSDAGRSPTPSESMIGGSAAALIMMTKILAQELARWKIRINTVCTTVTRDTPGYERIYTSDHRSVLKKVEEKIPFGLNTPADIAEAVLFLAGDGSNQITGQTISVTGGLSFPG
ncbi:MAG: SDR family NAD(P)-dependent oxidoreductase [Chloroflexota bacterium]